jgi:methylenetetrahydrofolate reductase (NADPH)
VRRLTPNIHLTCVNRSLNEINRALADLNALGIENVFALTGDYPKSGDAPGASPNFAMDSVQLVRLMDQMRQRGMPFWISVAVSPFKYTEADCAYQYLKLEKKVAVGADCAITQLGFDALKFREVKRYVDKRNIKIPLLGNVYILSAKAAEKMSKGEPPGCWVSPELLARIREEANAPDGGRALRLERAARMVAILRGLGYAGAYLGGNHQAESIRWIIRRSEALAPRWEEFAEELAWAPKNGFYFHETPGAAANSRGVVSWFLDAMSRLFPVNGPGRLRDFLTGILGWFDRRPVAVRALERIEYAIKAPLFGCEACGNCVLSHMEYVCPQTCPKNMRNGPCGGTFNGRCEVVDKPCIWVSVYDRAKATGRMQELRTYVPPRNTALQGTSSWINYFLNRDSRPENELVMIGDSVGTSGAEVRGAEKREQSKVNASVTPQG